MTECVHHYKGDMPDPGSPLYAEFTKYIGDKCSNSGIHLMYFSNAGIDYVTVDIDYT